MDYHQRVNSLLLNLSYFNVNVTCFYQQIASNFYVNVVLKEFYEFRSRLLDHLQKLFFVGYYLVWFVDWLPLQDWRVYVFVCVMAANLWIAQEIRLQRTVSEDDLKCLVLISTTLLVHHYYIKLSDVSAKNK